MENENKTIGQLDVESRDVSLNQAAHKKLDDFIATIAGQELDKELQESLQKKFNAALAHASKSAHTPGEGSFPSEKLGDEFDQLLFINKLDKSAQKKYSIYRAFDIGIRVFIALLLVLLGFGMIIMPAPPYFEMFTLFYLNPNDGVTIMDVISLIVAFIGIYILVRTLIKRK